MTAVGDAVRQTHRETLAEVAALVARQRRDTAEVARAFARAKSAFEDLCAAHARRDFDAGSARRFHDSVGEVHRLAERVHEDSARLHALHELSTQRAASRQARAGAAALSEVTAAGGEEPTRSRPARALP